MQHRKYVCPYKDIDCPAQVALHIQHSAADKGFDWTNIEGVLAKVHEETTEVLEAVHSQDYKHAQEELGDLLFAAFSVARFLDADPIACLDNAAQRFQKRFDCMEKMADEEGISLESCSAESLDLYWDRVKKLMRQ